MLFVPRSTLAEPRLHEIFHVAILLLHERFHEHSTTAKEAVVPHAFTNVTCVSFEAERAQQFTGETVPGLGVTTGAVVGRRVGTGVAATGCRVGLLVMGCSVLGSGVLGLGVGEGVGAIVGAEVGATVIGALVTGVGVTGCNVGVAGALVGAAAEPVAVRVALLLRLPDILSVVP